MRPDLSPEIAIVAPPELRQSDCAASPSPHRAGTISETSKPNSLTSKNTSNSQDSPNVTKSLSDLYQDLRHLLPRRAKTPADAVIIDLPLTPPPRTGSGKPKKPLGGPYKPRDDISGDSRVGRQYGTKDRVFSFSKFLHSNAGSNGTVQATRGDHTQYTPSEPLAKRRRVERPGLTYLSSDTGVFVGPTDGQYNSSGGRKPGNQAHKDHDLSVRSSPTGFTTGRASEYNKVEDTINPKRNIASSPLVHKPVNGTKSSPIMLLDDSKANLALRERREMIRSGDSQLAKAAESSPQRLKSHATTPTRNSRAVSRNMATSGEDEDSNRIIESSPSPATSKEKAKRKRRIRSREETPERRDSLDELQGNFNVTPLKKTGKTISSEHRSTLASSVHTPKKAFKESSPEVESNSHQKRIKDASNGWSIEMYRTDFDDHSNVLIVPDETKKYLRIQQRKEGQAIEVIDRSKIHKIRYSVDSCKVVIDGPKKLGSACVHAFSSSNRGDCKRLLQKLKDLEICPSDRFWTVDPSKMNNIFSEIANKREERLSRQAKVMGTSVQSDESLQIANKRRTSLSCPDSESKRLRNDCLLHSEAASNNTPQRRSARHANQNVPEQRFSHRSPSLGQACFSEQTTEPSNIHKSESWPEAIVYPSTGANRTTVEFNDISRLDDGEFLNDNIISFYLRYLSEYSGQYKDKVYFFNTYFFSRLTSGAKKPIDYEAVEKWTSKVNIFDYEYLVVPVNHSLHWYLVIIINSLHGERTEQSDQLKASPADSLSKAIWPSEHKTERDSDGSMSWKQDQMTSRLGSELHNLALDESVSVPRSISSEYTGEMLPLDRFDTSNFSERNISRYFNNSESKETKEGRLRPVKGEDNKLPDISSPPDLIAKEGKAKNEPPFTLVSLDSFGWSRPQVLRMLKLYLVEEAKSKLNRELDLKSFKGATAKGIPLQHNGCDCGVYLLGYVEKFMQDPRRFMEKLVNKEMSIKEDWPEMDPRQMRIDVREKLFEVQKAQENRRQRQLAAEKAKKGKETTRMPARSQEVSRRDTETQASDSPQITYATDGRRSGDAEEVNQEQASGEICSDGSITMQEKSPTSPQKAGVGGLSQQIAQGPEAIGQKRRVEGSQKSSDTEFFQQVRDYAGATKASNRV